MWKPLPSIPYPIFAYPLLYLHYIAVSRKSAVFLYLLMNAVWDKMTQLNLTNKKKQMLFYATGDPPSFGREAWLVD